MSDDLNRQLGESMEKRMKTIMIGALSEFEKVFGDIWGHGLPEDQLDDEMRRSREEWNEVRTKVLDRGNANIRSAYTELAKYAIEKKRYVYKFQIGDKNK